MKSIGISVCFYVEHCDAFVEFARDHLTTIEFKDKYFEFQGDGVTTCTFVATVPKKQIFSANVEKDLSMLLSAEYDVTLSPFD